jgi:glucose-6-phosphate 1-dehydrogenase
MTLISLPDSKRQHPTPAFDMIVFGGTGDLAMRKLMPSLMHRDIDGRLHPASRIVGIGRSPIGNEVFAKRVQESCRNAISPAFTEQSWAIFVRRLHYIALNGSKRNDYGILRDFLDDSDQTLDTSAVRVFTFAAQALVRVRLGGDRVAAENKGGEPWPGPSTRAIARIEP